MTTQPGNGTQYGGWRPRGVSMKRKSMLLVASGLLVLGAGTGVAWATGAASSVLGIDKVEPAGLTPQPILTGSPETAAQMLAVSAVTEQLNAEPTTNGGEYTPDGPSTLVIYTVGDYKPSAKLAPLVAKAQNAGVKVTYTPVTYSTAQLTDAMHVCDGGTLSSGVNVLECSIDPTTNHVEVKVAEADAQKAGVTDSRVHVTAVAAKDVTQKLSESRYFDTAPFYGSDFVTGVYHACTTAFKIFNKYGEVFRLTAGHCTPSAGTGDRWESSNPVTGGVGQDQGYTEVGMYGGYFNPTCNPSCHDVMGIGWGGQGQFGTESPLIYIGAGNSGTSQYATAATFPAHNQQLYVMGGKSGQSVQATVASTSGGCFHDLNTRYICDEWKLTPNVQAFLCQSGDSGSPVVGPDGHGGLIAVGILTDAEIRSDGTLTGNCYMLSFGFVLNKWQSSLALN